MHLIEFIICVIAGNGSRVVVSHQIFLNYISDPYHDLVKFQVITVKKRAALSGLQLIDLNTYTFTKHIYFDHDIIW